MTTENQTTENVGTCKGCGAPILWKLLKDRPHPYELDGITSHFAKCPHAASFRRKIPYEGKDKA